MPEIELSFIARQLERVLEGQAQLRDDIFVVMARVDRMDATLQGMVTELRAMHGRGDRLTRRIERLEARLDAPELA